MKHFSILILLALTSLVACDENNDPGLTDLELIQQSMIGKWELQEIRITKVETAIYKGGCDPNYLKYFPDWAKVNMDDIDYKITSHIGVIKISNCQNIETAQTFLISLDDTNNIYTIEFSDGKSFQLIGGTDTLNGPIVELKYLNVTGGAVQAIWVFKRS